MSEARGTPRKFARQHLAEYTGPPVPANDPERVAHLHALNVLDTEPDPRLDEITALLSKLFEVPVALINLLDSDRTWIKSAAGQPCGTSVPRQMSPCMWTLLPAQPEAFVVEDLKEDARFHDNPFVTNPPHTRFYASAPLVASNAMRLGTLCLMDLKPRQMDAESCTFLCNLADIVVREIERADHIVRAKALAAAQMHLTAPVIREEFPQCLTHGTMLLDISRPMWQILFASEACTHFMGLTRGELEGQKLWEVVAREGMSKEESWELYTICPEEIQTGEEFTVWVRPCNPSAEDRALNMRFWPAYKEPSTSQPIAVPGHVQGTPPTSDKHGYYFVTVNGAISGSEAGSGALAGMTDAELAAATQAVLPRVECEQVDGTRVSSSVDKPQLGALLQKTAHGKLCRGETPNGPCVVKITTRMEHLGNDADPQKVPCSCTEADCTRDLRHPNIAAVLGTQLVTREVDWLTKLHSPSKKLLQFDERPQTANRSSGQLGRSTLETWILREPCAGDTLRQAISRGVFLTERSMMTGLPAMPMLLKTMHEIACAVHYLHTKGLLHCNISGESVLLHSTAEDPRGFVVKLADFDMIRPKDAPLENPLAYNSLMHLAPETILDGQLSQESDVFAFGVLLFEALTSQHPWLGVQDVDYIVGLTQTDAQLEWPEWTPFAYEELAAWCMARHPRNRPAFDRILLALEELQRVADLNNPDAWNSLTIDLALHADAHQGW
ncbi:hypothetical protein WJX72_012174 [[Myrmecia] bisecta]|uniref:Protein kinase domain-containing protein n=1 Tax=[Myrmecia] bisecta TaxID=41462 RepID=A0AAW1Q5R0_9CHLO